MAAPEQTTLGRWGWTSIRSSSTGASALPGVGASGFWAETMVLSCVIKLWKAGSMALATSSACALPSPASTAPLAMASRASLGSGETGVGSGAGGWGCGTTSVRLIGALTRGAGVVSQPRVILDRIGVKAAVVSGERTVLGLGRLLGFSVIDRPGFTAGADTDLSGKFQAVIEALAEHDMVYLHIKATDIFSHSMDPVGKRDCIERIDEALEAVMDDNLIVAIAADHSTDSGTGRHCGDPVPFLVRSPRGRVDTVNRYGESDCAQGGLGRITSMGLLLTLLDAMDRLTNYHPSDAAFVDVV